MKIRLILAVTAFAAVLLTSCVRPTAEQKVNFIVNRISEKLNLTGEQRMNLLEIGSNIIRDFRAQKTEREQVLDDWIIQLRNNTMDTNKLESISKKVSGLNSDIINDIKWRLKNFMNNLTPEQRGKLADWLEKWKERMDQMM